MLIAMQLVQMGYCSEDDVNTDMDAGLYECGHCNARIKEPAARGRITLTVEDQGERLQLWSKESLVEKLIPRPASDWGEPDSPDRNIVKHLLQEWVGSRYCVKVFIQGGRLYCVQLKSLDEKLKKRRM